MTYYDTLETRSPDRREAEQFAALSALHGMAIDGPSALARLPVMRKSDLGERQKADPPFGGLTRLPPAGFRHLFQSPGPLHEPGGATHDWWRMGRFLHAAGIGPGDIVQNCFSYHLTPAGAIFESGAEAVGATVIPAGTGQTELQAQAAHALGATAYAGTPDFLKPILDKAAELGLALAITRAVVGGGALFPSLRAEYRDRGIRCLQCYATADLGNIAYESPAPDGTVEGMVVDEGVIVEIVRPGTGDPVAPGEVGEVVVTALNPDYPLVRFATGDLSAILPGPSPCGRTGPRIRGWMGRADQTTKVRGMFVRPEQIAEIARRHPGVGRLQLVVTREGEADAMHLRAEADSGDAELSAALARSVQEVTKLRATVELVRPASLRNDGKVIDDRRRYGA